MRALARCTKAAARGLEPVARIARARNKAHAQNGCPDVVMVNQALGHIWKPRLHEIPTAMQNQALSQTSFWGRARQHAYRFEKGSL